VNRLTTPFWTGRSFLHYGSGAQRRLLLSEIPGAGGRRPPVRVNLTKHLHIEGVVLLIQVAAPSWAATQVPEITLAIQSCLKTGFLRAVQVEHLVMIGNEGPIFCLFPAEQYPDVLISIGSAGLIQTDL
jgi:hypothetical protein